MPQTARQRFDFADYVRLEEVAAVKHEFLDGAVWAMAGGSPEHARLQVAVSTLLSQALSGQRGAVYSSDLRVRVQATGLGTYPDVTVVCGQLELDPEDPKRQTVLNPRFIVEVLSPSTEDYDRGEKLASYKRVPTLEVIALVAHDQHLIEVWSRLEDGWELASYRDDETARLGPVNLPIAAVYRNPLAP